MTREKPSEREQLAAVNDLINGVWERWEPHTACAILAQALGGVVARRLKAGEVVTLKPYLTIARQTLLDIVDGD